MKKCWLLILLLCASGLTLRAQNDFFFGHYMFNPVYFNPGWAGGEQKAFVALQHRSQWLGYTTSFDGSGGAPNTQMASAVVPIRNFVLDAVGLIVSNDNLGPVSNIQLQLPIARTFRFRPGNLSVGVAPSVYSQVLNGNLYRANNPNDPIIPGGREVQTNFNLSAGIFYQASSGWFVGAGASNLMQPSFDFGVDGLENTQEITYSAHGGYTLKFGKELELSPSVLVRSNVSSITFDLGGILNIKDKMWTGISYRRNESAIIYLGYSLLQDNILKVGYSFDYVVQDRDAKAPTSHEFFIRYDLPDLVFGGRKMVKTPRFTF